MSSYSYQSHNSFPPQVPSMTTGLPPMNVNMNTNIMMSPAMNMMGQPLTTGVKHPYELFVGDLSFFCEEKDLLELFSRFGVVDNCRIVRNDNKNRSLMFGFVCMSTLEEAILASDTLNNFMFMGRAMKVELSEKRQTMSSSASAQAHQTAFVMNGYQIHLSFSSNFHPDHVTRPTEAFLREFFSQFGLVVEVVVREYTIYQGTNKQEGYGFLTFEEEEPAVRAAHHCKSVIVDGILISSKLSYRNRPTGKVYDLGGGAVYVSQGPTSQISPSPHSPTHSHRSDLLHAQLQPTYNDMRGVGHGGRGGMGAMPIQTPMGRGMPNYGNGSVSQAAAVLAANRRVMGGVNAGMPVGASASIGYNPPLTSPSMRGPPVGRGMGMGIHGSGGSIYNNPSVYGNPLPQSVPSPVVDQNYRGIPQDLSHLTLSSPQQMGSFNPYGPTGNIRTTGGGIPNQGRRQLNDPAYELALLRLQQQQQQLAMGMSEYSTRPELPSTYGARPSLSSSAYVNNSVPLENNVAAMNFDELRMSQLSALSAMRGVGGANGAGVGPIPSQYGMEYPPSFQEERERYAAVRSLPLQPPPQLSPQYPYQTTSSSGLSVDTIPSYGNFSSSGSTPSSASFGMTPTPTERYILPTGLDHSAMEERRRNEMLHTEMLSRSSNPPPPGFMSGSVSVYPAAPQLDIVEPESLSLQQLSLGDDTTRTKPHTYQPQQPPQQPAPVLRPPPPGLTIPLERGDSLEQERRLDLLIASEDGNDDGHGNYGYDDHETFNLNDEQNGREN